MKTTSITRSRIWSALSNGSKPEALVGRILRRPQLLPEIFSGLDQPPARIRFGCAKVLLLTSRRNPKILRPYWKQLIHRLDSDNRILQWSTMLTLGNLATAVSLSRARALLTRLLAPICGPTII